jgi:uncharacterized repeat protein (TIGR01451 family)
MQYLPLILYGIKSSFRLTAYLMVAAILITGLTLSLQSRGQGLVITVNSSGDEDDQDVDFNRIPDKVCNTANGDCTLRAALQTHNANSRDLQGNIVTNTIVFNIRLGQLGSVQRLLTATPLPSIGGTLILDATTQPGYKKPPQNAPLQLKPLIQLDGINAQLLDNNGRPIIDPVTELPLPVTGLTIGERGSTIKGFHIINFTGKGIAIMPTGGVAENNIIENNIVGSSTGNQNQGNKTGGILITGTFRADNNWVKDNIIAGNGGPGVEVRDARSTSPNSQAIGNNIQRNNIYNNVGIDPGTGLPDNNLGLGIDLVLQGTPNGVTPNDAAADPDNGPNLFQNFPVSVTAIAINVRNQVTVQVNNRPLTLYRVEIFASPSCDPSGNGEGQVFLTSTSQVTNGNGLLIIQYLTAKRFPKGWVFTATATDVDGNTSEFSACSTPLAAASTGISDLALVYSANKNSLVVGETIIFTLRLTNQGPDAASTVNVEDIAPTGIAFSSVTPSAGTYIDSSGIWTVPLLGSGAEATLVITGVATETGPVTSTAEIVYSDQDDPDSSPANSSHSDSVEDDLGSVSIQVMEGTLLAADLELAKVSDKTQVTTGEQVTFKLTVSNKGPAAATNVAVKDVAPAGFNFGPAVPSQGSYNPTTGIWTVGVLNSGASATLNIPGFAPQAGTITNIAEVSASDQADPDSSPNNGAATEDDQSSVSINVQQAAATADLELVKTADRTSLATGESVTFTLTLINKGPNTATGIQVSDVAPAGLIFSQVNATSGNYNSSNGTWSISSLNSGSQAVLTIIATASQLGTIINKAEVKASDQKDPDSTPDNGVAGEDDQSSVSVQVIDVISIEAQIKQLVTQVDDLVRQNKLNRLHGRVLSELLNVTLELYKRGFQRASILTLKAFILSVNQLERRRQLSATESQKLVSAAQKIIQQLESKSSDVQGSARSSNTIEEIQPKSFRLYANYPNPFYASTVVSFDLGKESKTQLFVYDARGRMVSALVDKVLPAGKHFITWQPKSLPAGVYILWFRSGNYMKTERMVMIK